MPYLAYHYLCMYMCTRCSSLDILYNPSMYVWALYNSAACVCICVCTSIRVHLHIYFALHYSLFNSDAQLTPPAPPAARPTTPTPPVAQPTPPTPPVAQPTPPPVPVNGECVCCYVCCYCMISVVVCTVSIQYWL